MILTRRQLRKLIIEQAAKPDSHDQAQALADKINKAGGEIDFGEDFDALLDAVEIYPGDIEKQYRLMQYQEDLYDVPAPEKALTAEEKQEFKSAIDQLEKEQASNPSLAGYRSGEPFYKPAEQSDFMKNLSSMGLIDMMKHYGDEPGSLTMGPGSIDDKPYPIRENKMKKNTNISRRKLRSMLINELYAIKNNLIEGKNIPKDMTLAHWLAAANSAVESSDMDAAEELVDMYDKGSVKFKKNDKTQKLYDDLVRVVIDF